MLFRTTISSSLRDGMFSPTDSICLMQVSASQYSLRRVGECGNGFNRVTSIAKIAEILNAGLELPGAGSHTYLQLAIHLNKLIAAHNCALYQSSQTLTGQLLNAIPYVKAAIGHAALLPQTDTISIYLLKHKLNHYISHPKEIRNLDLTQLRQQIEQLQSYCLYSTDERDLIDFLLRELETYDRLEKLLGMRALDSMPGDFLARAPTVAELKKRINQIREEIQGKGGNPQGIRRDEWQSLIDRLLISEIDALRSVCPCLSRARGLKIHLMGEFEGVRNRNPSEIAAFFERVLKELEITAEVRSKIGPEEETEIREAQAYLKQQYARWASSYFKDFDVVESISTDADLAGLRFYVQHAQQTQASRITVQAYENLLKNLETHLFLKTKNLLGQLPNLEGCANSHSLTVMIQSFRPLPENAVLFGQVNVKEYLDFAGKRIVNKRVPAYHFAQRHNYGSEQTKHILEQFKECKTIAEMCTFAEQHLAKLKLDQRARAFLSQGEIAFVEQQSQYFYLCYLDALMSLVPQAYSYPDYERIFSALKEGLNSPIKEEKKKLIRAIMNVREQIIRFIHQRAELFKEEEGELTPVSLPINEQIERFLVYDLHLKKMISIYSADVKMDPTPWKEHQTIGRELFCRALVDLHDAQGLAFLYEMEFTTLTFNQFFDAIPLEPIDHYLKAKEKYTELLELLQHDQSMIPNQDRLFNTGKERLNKAFHEWESKFFEKYKNVVPEEQKITLPLLNFLHHCHLEYDRVSAPVRRIFHLYVPVHAAFAASWERYTSYYIKRTLAETGYAVKVTDIPEADNATTLFVIPNTGLATVHFVHPVTKKQMGIQIKDFRKVGDVVAHLRLLNAQAKELKEFPSQTREPPLADCTLFNSTDKLTRYISGQRSRSYACAAYDEGTNSFVVVFDSTLNASNVLDHLNLLRVKAPANVCRISSLLELERAYYEYIDQQELTRVNRQFKLSHKSLHTLSPASEIKVPDMPRNLVRTNLTWLATILSKINFTLSHRADYINPERLIDDMGGKLTAASVKKFLNYMIKSIKEKLSYRGVPDSYEAKRKWYWNLESLLRNAILIMRDRLDSLPLEEQAKYTFDISTLVLEFAKTTGHCGGRWIDEANILYGVVSGRLDVLFDGDLVTVLHKILDNLKVGIVEAMSREGMEVLEYDPSHGYLFIMRQLYNLKYAIPQAQLADYDDPYLWNGTQGRYHSKDLVEEGFKAKATAEAGVGAIHQACNARLIGQNREVVLNHLREVVKEHSRLKPQLEGLRKEHAEAINKLEAQKKQESALTQQEMGSLVQLARLKTIDYVRMAPKGTLKEQILALIASKPSACLEFNKEWSKAEFDHQLEEEQRANLLTQADRDWIRQLEKRKENLTTGEKEKLSKLVDLKACQLHHAGTGEWISSKLGKNPYVYPDLIRKFGLNVVTFQKQIDALKEQQAAEMVELIDQFLIEEKLLRREMRLLPVPNSHQMALIPIVQLTVAGTLRLMNTAQLLEPQ